MELTAKTDDLLAALSTAAAFAPVNPPQPILSHVLMRCTEGGGIEVCASDLVCEVREQVAAKAKGGSIALPAKQLVTLLRSRPGETVRISQVKAMASIDVGGGSYKVPWLDPSSAPAWRSTPAGKGLDIPASALRTLILAVGFAATIDESRPQLCGIYFQLGDGILLASAANGHRMALHTASITSVDGIEPGAIWTAPTKFLDELARRLAGLEGDVTIRLTGKAVFVSCASWTISSALLPEGYPAKFETIFVPRPNYFRVHKDDLTAAIKRATIFAEDVILRAAHDAVIVESSATDRGEGSERVKVADMHVTEGAFVGMSGKYALEALASLPGDTVTVNMVGDLEHVYFGGEGYGDGRTQVRPVVVVMPVKV